MRNRDLDCLRLVSALFVVFIHICLPGTAGEIASAAARFAVPVFFISSGYFSYRLINEGDMAKLKKRTAHIAVIFAVSLLVYIIGYTILYGIPFLQSFFSNFAMPDMYLKTLVFNLPFTTSFGHLWFLTALIYVYLVTALIIKLRITKIFKFLPFLLILTLIYFNIIMGKMQMEVSTLLCRNFLMIGLPFFSVGYCMRKFDWQRIKNINTYIVILLLAGIVINIAEFIFLSRNSELYLGSVLIAVSLFALAVYRNSANLSKKSRVNIPSDLSLYIYVTHILASHATDKLSTLTGFYYTSVYEWLRPLIAVVTSVAVYYAVYGIKKLFSKKREIAKA